MTIQEKTEYELYALSKDDLIEHILDLYTYKHTVQEFVILCMETLEKIKKIEKLHAKYLEVL